MTPRVDAGGQISPPPLLLCLFFPHFRRLLYWRRGKYGDNIAAAGAVDVDDDDGDVMLCVASVRNCQLPELLRACAAAAVAAAAAAAVSAAAAIRS